MVPFFFLCQWLVFFEKKNLGSNPMLIQHALPPRTPPPTAFHPRIFLAVPPSPPPPPVLPCLALQYYPLVEHPTSAVFETVLFISCKIQFRPSSEWSSKKKKLESNPSLIWHNLAPRTIPTNDSNGSMEVFKHELHIVVGKKRDAKIEMRRGGVEQAAAAAAMLGQQ